jgi:hypothetical protein
MICIRQVKHASFYVLHELFEMFFYDLSNFTISFFLFLLLLSFLGSLHSHLLSSYLLFILLFSLFVTLFFFVYPDHLVALFPFFFLSFSLWERFHDRWYSESLLTMFLVSFTFVERMKVFFTVYCQCMNAERSANTCLLITCIIRTTPVDRLPPALADKQIIVSFYLNHFCCGLGLRRLVLDHCNYRDESKLCIIIVLSNISNNFEHQLFRVGHSILRSCRQGL